MSDENKSLFEGMFGKDNPMEALFGRGGVFDQAFRKGSVTIMSRGSKTKKTGERARYQESLMTELLITLAGKGVLTNAEAQDVIRRAKERAKQKSETEAVKKPSATTTPPATPDAEATKSGEPPCGGTCPIHDTRPHRNVECQRCKLTTPHLVEGEILRCRVCLTPRTAS